MKCLTLTLHPPPSRPFPYLLIIIQLSLLYVINPTHPSSIKQHLFECPQKTKQKAIVCATSMSANVLRLYQDLCMGGDCGDLSSSSEMWRLGYMKVVFFLFSVCVCAYVMSVCFSSGWEGGGGGLVF
jgi:hypothetical protein